MVVEVEEGDAVVEEEDVEVEEEDAEVALKGGDRHQNFVPNYNYNDLYIL